MSGGEAADAADPAEPSKPPTKKFKPRWVDSPFSAEMGPSAIADLLDRASRALMYRYTRLRFHHVVADNADGEQDVVTLRIPRAELEDLEKTLRYAAWRAENFGRLISAPPADET